jgi:TetR/AcrR family transcriptional regulator, transcriptional repressor for nem operon
MPRPRKLTDDAVIQAAMELFWNRPYADVSIHDVEQATNLNRSSLYLYFGSKGALFEKALERYVTMHLDPPLSAWLDSAPPGGVERFLEDTRARVMSNREDPGRGCLLVSTMTATPSYVAQALISDYRERLRDGFATALYNNGMDKEEAFGRARLLQVAVFGVWAVARTDVASAVAACHVLLAEVGGWD